MTDDKAKQTPLIEQLDAVPFRARLAIDDPDGMGTSYIPVGRYCHEAAAELRRLDALNAELVGVLNAIEVQCENIRKSDWRQWQELASPEEFERWAKSRARQMAIAASEASAKAKEQT